MSLNSIPPGLRPTSSPVQFHGPVSSQNSGSSSVDLLPWRRVRVFHPGLTLEKLPTDMIGHLLAFDPNAILSFLQTGKCLHEKVIALLSLNQNRINENFRKGNLAFCRSLSTHPLNEGTLEFHRALNAIISFYGKRWRIESPRFPFPSLGEIAAFVKKLQRAENAYLLTLPGVHICFPDFHKTVEDSLKNQLTSLFPNDHFPEDFIGTLADWAMTCLGKALQRVPPNNISTPIPIESPVLLPFLTTLWVTRSAVVTYATPEQIPSCYLGMNVKIEMCTRENTKVTVQVQRRDQIEAPQVEAPPATPPAPACIQEAEGRPIGVLRPLNDPPAFPVVPSTEVLVSGRGALERALHHELARTFTEMQDSSFRQQFVNAALHHWDQSLQNSRIDYGMVPAQVEFRIYLFKNSDNSIESAFMIWPQLKIGARRICGATRTSLLVQVGKPPECAHMQPSAPQTWAGERRQQRCTLQ